MEGAVAVDVAPREIDEPLAALTLHRRSLEVEGAVIVHLDAHVEAPLRRAGIASDQVGGFPAHLDADVHVGARRVLLAEAAPGQVVAADHDLHTCMLAAALGWSARQAGSVPPA